MRWRKSTFSAGDSNCVEVAWRKSCFSGSDSNRVELMWSGVEAAIRDSKNRGAGQLTVPARAFARLLSSVR
jgi:uncharacterized protein DUF397